MPRLAERFEIYKPRKGQEEKFFIWCFENLGGTIDVWYTPHLNKLGKRLEEFNLYPGKKYEYDFFNYSSYGEFKTIYKELTGDDDETISNVLKGKSPWYKEPFKSSQLSPWPKKVASKEHKDGERKNPDNLAGIPSLGVLFRTYLKFLYYNENSDIPYPKKQKVSENQMLKSEESQNPPAQNIIFFGAPGTGKSYKLNELAENEFSSRYQRVTFHSNYSYGQFVGMYKPVAVNNSDITYAFISGPFVKTLTKAIENPENSYLLIIEEINRADAAAVFGEVFQLLDRNADGESEYGIDPQEDLKKYLDEKVPNWSEKWDGQLKIPSNMSIYATMNSADQGIYPIDTAFKRRWSFEYISIKNGGDSVQDLWKGWVDDINKKLLDNDIEEDKQLGYHFIANTIVGKGCEQIEPLEKNSTFVNEFKNKVIMYLFEDAAKFIREELFGTSVSLSKLFERFDAWVECGCKDVNDGSKKSITEMLKEDPAPKRPSEND